MMFGEIRRLYLCSGENFFYGDKDDEELTNYGNHNYLK